jgi:hypothetical protein
MNIKLIAYAWKRMLALAATACFCMLPTTGSAEPGIPSPVLTGNASNYGMVPQTCSNCLSSTTGTTLLTWHCASGSGCLQTEKRNLWPTGAHSIAFYLQSLKFDSSTTLVDLGVSVNGVPVSLLHSEAAGIGSYVHDASNPYYFNMSPLDGIWALSGQGYWTASTTIDVVVAVLWEAPNTSTPPPMTPPPAASVSEVLASALICGVNLSWNTNGGANVASTIVEVRRPALDNTFANGYVVQEVRRFSGSVGATQFSGTSYCGGTRQFLVFTRNASGVGTPGMWVQQDLLGAWIIPVVLELP